MLTEVMGVLIMLKFWNFFNPEMQLKDTESAINNKLIDLLTKERF